MKIIRTFHTLLCGAKLLHYVFPAMMLYLIAGTIAQKYMGLYHATQMFFTAPILWVGVVPLPGMPVFIGVIALNLIFKLIFESTWSARHAGIIIAHMGVLLLLLGGLLTMVFAREGSIALGLNETTQSVSAYHTRHFVVLDEQGAVLARFDPNALHINQKIESDALPFTLHIKELCQHCEIIARADKTPLHKGMAAHMRLKNAPLHKNDEENMAGITFQIIHKETQDIFVVLEDIPQYPRISIAEQAYHFALRKTQTPLPFTLQLLDFQKESYPGTTMAKAYRSRVLITDGAVQWESEISMNAPLRYKGYTFFQSSFIDAPQGAISVLTAVWNIGRNFPYIAGLTICIGLILHLFLRRRDDA